MKRIVSCVVVSLMLAGCESANTSMSSVDKKITTAGVRDSDIRIAFGSCLKGSESMDVLASVAGSQSDMFVFAGDNVYATTTDPVKLAEYYQDLADRPQYQQLKEAMPIVATWDDHDYGVNDGGTEHPTKVQAQQVMLDHFDEPANSPRRLSEGVYTDYWLGSGDQRVHLILLDTRYFRSPIKRELTLNGGLRFAINDAADATVLGSDQWGWLQSKLQEPAALKIVVSSIQVLSDRHPYEKWGNFPKERQRLLDLIDEVQGGVVLVSGDRHFSEISGITSKSGHRLYEMTASGMNTDGRYGQNEDNPYRVNWVGHQGYGVLDVQWHDKAPSVVARFYNPRGELVLTRPLSHP